MAKKQMTRRDLLKNAATVTAGIGTLSTLSSITRPARVFGANDRVRIGVCGLRGRGKDHLDAFSRVPNVEIAALCDVDDAILRKRREEVGGNPRTFADVRRLLEDPQIDAISIATPNHWHALIAIWACQAGKDVYVEKPCSHNLWEGRQLVRAAQKYRRIVQHGTQSRSAPAMIEAIRQVHAGTFGGIYLARGLCFKRRDTIGHAAAEPAPRGVDYDLWTGPAPVKPFTQNRFHYNWHWNWDTGNGDLGNQGVHQVDAARWGLGVGFPDRISAMGGHFMFDDDQETPNTLACTFGFDQPDGSRKLLEFGVRHWITNGEAGFGRGGLFSRHNAIGSIFYGSKGYLAAGNEDSFSYESWLGTDQAAGPHGKSGNDHFANFVTCVRSRNAADLRAPIEEGHVSCGLVHLANASYRLGRSLRFDAHTERVIDDDEANHLLDGRTRGYRAPFVIPDEV
ncbi:MAG TPA: Gfo/Idh/MocA family oxidoreductase [Vicinamibacterales bacterium]|nr:Gfo/Idh/MocA family oxidoreductase [Vicinamibacterales bacterium]